MKKSLAALATLVAATLSISSCSSSSSAAPASNPGPVALTFWHGYTEADGGVLNKIVDQFNASQTGVKITTQVKTWAVIGDTLLPALSANKGPDIVAMPAEQLPVYAAKGAFASLDKFYASADSNTAALNPQAVKMEVINSVRYGIPTGFVPLSVFYNKTLFKAAGITTFPTTWDQWVADAQKLTVDKNGSGTPQQYGLVLPDHSTVGNGVWASLFYGNGGDIVSDGKAVLNSAANQATLTYWSNAINTKHISPKGVDGVGSDKLFSSGKAAMEVGGPWMASVSKDNKIDYGIAPIPAGPKAAASSAIGISMGVTAQADAAKVAAAEQFFAYFNSKSVATQWSLGSGWPPLRTDIPASAVSANPVVAALTQIAGTARPLLPGVANSVDVLTAVDVATQKAVAGGDVMSLLTAAQSSTQSALG